MGMFKERTFLTSEQVIKFSFNEQYIFEYRNTESVYDVKSLLQNTENHMNVSVIDFRCVYFEI